MAQTTSVLWSVDQGLGEKAKEQARQNIGAASEKLTEVVNNHTEKIEANTTEIGQIKVDVADIESSLLNKKDKQQLKSFKGSSKQTIKNISQTENGELSVEFEVIDFPDFKLPSDVVRDSNYVHIDGATEVPLKDGITSVGVSTKYAREDHIHPTDTSREAIANKTTVILGTSNDKYPTDEAVAKFVNSSIATNTANYISNNGNPFTSVEQLNAYTGTVTNNDYAFVNGIDSDGNTYYDRYKATVKGSSVTWSLEYRLNNSSFTAAQWSAINSGITSTLVAKIHEHSNKAVLDGITSDNVSNWNNKMDNQTVGGASEPVYLENGIAKIATGVATKTDLNNLTEVVNGHTTEIGQIKDDVAGIESSLTDKKDKQLTKTFKGSSTKTVTNISQDENGELIVKFEDIDFNIYWVKHNPGSQTPTVNKSSISVVTSDSGTCIQNDIASAKFYVAPDYTSSDKGKYFGIDSDGIAKWLEVPTPKSTTMEQSCYCLRNIITNTQILGKFNIPVGTTKIIGSLDCYPTTGFDSLSIVTLKDNNNLYNVKHSVNAEHLSTSESNDTINTIPFQFHLTGNPNDGTWKYIAIKGKHNSNTYFGEYLSNDYHINNIMITYIKEK